MNVSLTALPHNATVPAPPGLRIARRAAIAAFSAAGVYLLGACAVTAPYEPPRADLPASWGEQHAAASTSGPGTRWWTLYEEPQLDGLIEEALRHNVDLQLAVERVDEARAQLGIARSNGAVRVDATATAGRSRHSALTGERAAGTPLEHSDYGVGVRLSYELDLWGRLKAGHEAARAELLATDAARQMVQVALATDVAQLYFSIQSLNEQIAAVQRSIGARGNAVRFQKKRFEAGVVSRFEMEQVRSDLSSAEVLLPQLERRRAQAGTALGVLLGRTPREIFDDSPGAIGAVHTAFDARPADAGTLAEAPAMAKTDPAPRVPPLVVPAGLPSELLLRRPDVLAAERRLIGLNARITEARASLFPSIVLTGNLGTQSLALSDLFSGPAGAWSLAVGLLQPIFNGGRLRADLEVAQSRERQAVLQYQRVLQTAFKEVRDALDGQTFSLRQLEGEARRAELLREARSMAYRSYESGVAGLLDVLDAERNLLAAELGRAEAARAQRAAMSELFKAMGGGWS